MLNIIRKITKIPRYYLAKLSYPLCRENYGLYEASLVEMFGGKDVLVVGNGPSLKITDLDALKHLPSIGMNKIHMIFESVAWRPSLIAVTNTLVTGQLVRSGYNPVIPYVFVWKNRFFAKNFAKNRRFFVLTRPSSGFEQRRDHPMYEGHTVTQLALQLAFLAGAKRVILIGVDHNFNGIKGANNIQKFVGEDNNHFHPDYFKGQRWGVPNLEGSEEGYLLARRAFESVGGEVVDATIGGKLEIFKKIDINSIYQRS